MYYNVFINLVNFVLYGNFSRRIFMFYEAELRLLRDTLRKCRIQTGIADLSVPPDHRQDLHLHTFLSSKLDASKPLRQLLPAIKPATIYRLTDPFHCRYMFLLLPALSADMLFFIGPYLSQAPSQQHIMELSEERGIAPSQLKSLESYYASVPILPDGSQLLALLDAFGERLWGINGFSLEDIESDPLAILSPLAEKKSPSDERDTLWTMQSMEQRYFYENELMEAVSNGQLHKADMLLSNFSTFSFEQRVADPVRNAKNYCIIMNTLLRKAAERGGVHPMYLDSTSSAYATRIEQLPSVETVAQLITEMFRTYCRLVRKHSMKDFSPPVQKALIYIDSNLAGNLSLCILAEALNVSNSYLSSLFRKETGQTLTEYINQRRIRHAMHLLETTRLQIQTVAQHCGIVDVQYFSKVFKRIAGMTPKEYRESRKR